MFNEDRCSLICFNNKIYQYLISCACYTYYITIGKPTILSKYNNAKLRMINTISNNLSEHKT